MTQILSPHLENPLDCSGQQRDNELLRLIDLIYEREMAKQTPVSSVPWTEWKLEKPALPEIELQPRRAPGELGAAIMEIIYEAGPAGTSLRDIATKANSTPGEVSNWIYNNRHRVTGLKKLSRGRYAYDGAERYISQSHVHL